MDQARAEKLKILAVTSPERLSGDEFLETLPTAKEQGIDAEFIVWRGLSTLLQAFSRVQAVREWRGKIRFVRWTGYPDRKSVV